MDLDAFVAEHQPTWERLVTLTRRLRLTGPEADEFVAVYQSTASHLSQIRSESADPAVVAYLSGILTRARTRTGRRGTSSWRATREFFTTSLPAALYRLRWWWGVTTLANVAICAVLIGYLLANPALETSLMPPEAIDDLVAEDFESYYTEHSSGSFATLVWTNNAWVAAQCIAMGVFGLPVIYVLFQNVLNVAIIGSIMIRNDRGDIFFGLILPHGLLELTAIFVAAGVGLSLFWAWVSPGAATRGRSLAQAGRTAMTVTLGLVVILLISGLIEGFVTPSALPPWAKISIGVLAELAFLAYVWGPGRAAVRNGTARQEWADLPDQAAVAA